MVKIMPSFYDKVVCTYLYLNNYNKTSLAKKYHVSTRTITRVINEVDRYVGASNLDTLFYGLDVYLSLSPDDDFHKKVGSTQEDVGYLKEFFKENFKKEEDLDYEYEEKEEDVDYSKEESDSPVYNVIATPASITVYKNYKNETSNITVTKNNVVFDKAYEFVSNSSMTPDNLQKLYEMCSIRENIVSFSHGNLDVNPNTRVITYQGYRIDSDIVDVIFKLNDSNDKKGTTTLLNFLDRLIKNTSHKSVKSLYSFLKHNDIEIREDGMIVGWKKIREDYTDSYSGTVDNSVGQCPSMPRNMVSDDVNKTCSYGYHVGAASYVKHFSGSRIVKVIVDPEDVVCVPTDYDGAKMRCCRYKVVEEVTDTFDEKYK